MDHFFFEKKIVHHQAAAVARVLRAVVQVVGRFGATSVDTVGSIGCLLPWGELGERPTPMLCWRSMKRMGASLKGGTPHFTPQNDQFLVGKPMVVGYHHFRKPPYIYPVFFVGWQKVSFWAMKIVNPYHLRILLMVQKSGKFTSWGW